MQLRDGAAVAHVNAALVGFVHGAAGGVMVADAFLDAFCVDYSKSSPVACRAPVTQLPPAWLTFVALFNVAFFVGGGVGVAASAWLVERSGRRVASVSGALLVTAGSLAVALTPAHAHSQLLLTRGLQGVGVGSSSLSLLLLLTSAEIRSHATTREVLFRSMYLMVGAGVLLANVANVALENVTDGWRYTNALAVVPAAAVMLMSCCMLESPLWLFKKRGRESARTALQALRITDDVDDELEAIGELVAAESNSARWRAIWAVQSLRRRFLVATVLQLLQQGTGISVVLTYGGHIFEAVATDGVLSLLIVSIVNFASAIPAMRWLDATGRRQLLLLGAAGMFLGHLVSASVATAGCNDSGCSKAAGFAIISSTAFFVFNFAISWGPVCWIYSTEIFSTSYRARAVAIAALLNWSAGALTTGVPSLFPTLGVNGVLFLFAALCVGGGTFVFWMCPETQEIALEEIELLFDGSSVHESAIAQSVASDQSQHALSPPVATLPQKYDQVTMPDTVKS